MVIEIVPVYAAILTLIFVVLSIRTLNLRRKLKVLVGDREDMTLRRAIRAHGHFAEYVPLAIVLMLLLELKGATGWLHVVGIVLIVGRLIHAFGISRDPEDVRLRVAGMGATLFVLISSAIRLLIASF